jgi:hypothetical protein
MRWLERYLSEGAPRLQHFEEVAASLAKREPLADVLRRRRIHDQRSEFIESGLVSASYVPRGAVHLNFAEKPVRVPVCDAERLPWRLGATRMSHLRECVTRGDGETRLERPDVDEPVLTPPRLTRFLAHRCAILTEVPAGCSPDFPLGEAFEVFVRREDAERLIEEVRLSCTLER